MLLHKFGAPTGVLFADYLGPSRAVVVSTEGDLVAPAVEMTIEFFRIRTAQQFSPLTLTPLYGEMPTTEKPYGTLMAM